MNQNTFSANSVKEKSCFLKKYRIPMDENEFPYIFVNIARANFLKYKQ